MANQYEELIAPIKDLIAYHSQERDVYLGRKDKDSYILHESRVAAYERVLRLIDSLKVNSG